MIGELSMILANCSQDGVKHHTNATCVQGQLVLNRPQQICCICVFKYIRVQNYIPAVRYTESQYETLHLQRPFCLLPPSGLALSCFHTPSHLLAARTDIQGTSYAP